MNNNTGDKDCEGLTIEMDQDISKDVFRITDLSGFKRNGKLDIWTQVGIKYRLR